MLPLPAGAPLDADGVTKMALPACAVQHISAAGFFARASCNRVRDVAPTYIRASVPTGAYRMLRVPQAGLD